ncbi:MAG TPA: hypothetical protein VFC63_07140 [Blastocatellia bacterium]|nr:hypothetical protein [Blastocatellia bacterium]
MTQLTIQIPEPLAQHLAHLAAEQKKSVEQVAVEHLTYALAPENLAGSPAAILRAIKEPPHLTEEDIAELERAIESGRMPLSERGIFDGSEN